MTEIQENPENFRYILVNPEIQSVLWGKSVIFDWDWAILKAYCEVIRMYIPHTRQENKRSLYNKRINNYNNSSLDTQFFSLLFLNWWNNKSYSKNFKMKRTLLKKLGELQWYTFVTYDMCTVFMKWNVSRYTFCYESYYYHIHF